MTAVKEMPRVEAGSSMSLEELREQLGHLRQGGRMRACDRVKMEKKMKEILVRLARLGQRGGLFGQVRLSEEARALSKRIC